MKRTLMTLLIAAAMVVTLGVSAYAVTGENGNGYNLKPGQINLFGLDNAGNRIVVCDRDAGASGLAQYSYGLFGTSQQ